MNSLDKNLGKTFEKVSAQQSPFVNALSGISSSPLIELTKSVNNIFTPLSKDTGIFKLIKEQQALINKINEPIKFIEAQKKCFESFSYILKESVSVNPLFKQHNDLKFCNYIDTSDSFVTSINNLLNTPNIQDDNVYSKELLNEVDKYINKTQDVTDCNVDVKHMPVIDRFKLAVEILSTIIAFLSLMNSILPNQSQENSNNNKNTVCNNCQNITINNYYCDITELDKIVITEIKKLFNIDK